MVSLSSVSKSIKNNYKQWLYFRNILHTKAIARCSSDIFEI